MTAPFSDCAVAGRLPSDRGAAGQVLWHGDRSHPGEVGLAGRLALEIGDHDDTMRRLEPGQVRSAMGGELAPADRVARPERRDRGYLLSPARIGHADDHRVEDGRMSLQDRLDL